ncbi:MAG: PHP domain-containing protein [Firmicutes bacterium]|nr:PHP domain-containing protein [Bacillota bacterium]
MIYNGIKKIDLHMHTTISDGTNTLSEILAAVKDFNIDIFSVTDHDSILGGIEMPKFLMENDPKFIRGVEFSCRDNEGKYHILGYGYDPDDDGLLKVVNKGHSFRLEKVAARLKYLKEEFGFEFSKEDIEELMAKENPGKPHIGNMMVKYGYAPSRDIAIKEYINKKKFKNVFIKPEEAIEGILSGGGIPILAHPIYGSGEELILGDEMEERLKKLMGFGIQGVEAFYSGFTEKMKLEMLNLAEKYNLFVTAGSDYHGKNKLVVLGDNNLDDIKEGPKGLYDFLDKVSCVNP